MENSLTKLCDTTLAALEDKGFAVDLLGSADPTRLRAIKRDLTAAVQGHCVADQCGHPRLLQQRLEVVLAGNVSNGNEDGPPEGGERLGELVSGEWLGAFSTDASAWDVLAIDTSDVDRRRLCNAALAYCDDIDALLLHDANRPGVAFLPHHSIRERIREARQFFTDATRNGQDLRTSSFTADDMVLRFQELEAEMVACGAALEMELRDYDERQRLVEVFASTMKALRDGVWQRPAASSTEPAPPWARCHSFQRVVRDWVASTKAFIETPSSVCAPHRVVHRLVADCSAVLAYRTSPQAAFFVLKCFVSDRVTRLRRLGAAMPTDEQQRQADRDATSLLALLDALPNFPPETEFVSPFAAASRSGDAQHETNASTDDAAQLGAVAWYNVLAETLDQVDYSLERCSNAGGLAAKRNEFIEYIDVVAAVVANGASAASSDALLARECVPSAVRTALGSESVQRLQRLVQRCRTWISAGNASSTTLSVGDIDSMLCKVRTICADAGLPLRLGTPIHGALVAAPATAEDPHGSHHQHQCAVDLGCVLYEETIRCRCALAAVGREDRRGGAGSHRGGDLDVALAQVAECLASLDVFLQRPALAVVVAGGTPLNEAKALAERFIDVCRSCARTIGTHRMPATALLYSYWIGNCLTPLRSADVESGLL